MSSQNDAFDLPPPKGSRKIKKRPSLHRIKRSLTAGSKSNAEDQLSFLDNSSTNNFFDDEFDNNPFRANDSRESLNSNDNPFRDFHPPAAKDKDILQPLPSASEPEEDAIDSEKEKERESGKENEEKEKDKAAEVKKIDAAIRKCAQRLRNLRAKRAKLTGEAPPPRIATSVARNKEQPNANANSAPKRIVKKRAFETIDAMDWMKKGSAMLKYGRFGYPHFRHFELSRDGQFIQWYSSGKKMDKSRIDLRSVSKLQRGQLTATFKKHLQPRLASCSFSLLYTEKADKGGKQKSLDVITKNKNAYVLWTKGLELIIAYNQRIHQRVYAPSWGPTIERDEDEDAPTAFPTSIMVKVAKRDERHIEQRLSLQPEPPRKMVEKELKDATERFEKLMVICSDAKYVSLSEMEPVKKRIVELEEDVENIKLSFEKKKLNIASHEIWRTAVELKALENKIQAIGKTQNSGTFFGRSFTSAF